MQADSPSNLSWRWLPHPRPVLTSLGLFLSGHPTQLVPILYCYCYWSRKIVLVRLCLTPLLYLLLSPNSFAFSSSSLPLFFFQLDRLQDHLFRYLASFFVF